MADDEVEAALDRLAKIYLEAGDGATVLASEPMAQAIAADDRLLQALAPADDTALLRACHERLTTLWNALSEAEMDAMCARSIRTGKALAGSEEEYSARSQAADEREQELYRRMYPERRKRAGNA